MTSGRRQMILRTSCRPVLGTFVSWLVHTINAVLAKALHKATSQKFPVKSVFTLGRIGKARSARVPRTQFTPWSYVKRNRRVLCFETRKYCSSAHVYMLAIDRAWHSTVAFSSWRSHAVSVQTHFTELQSQAVTSMQPLPRSDCLLFVPWTAAW